MYKYFVPDEPGSGSGAIGLVSDKGPSTHSRGDILPLYDEDGEVTGYILKPKKGLDESVKQLPLGEQRVPMRAPTATVLPPPAKKALDIDWDGWPDGNFEQEFTFEEVDTYNNLQVHWATKSHGVRGGNNFAEDWVDGKRLHRDCLGIIDSTPDNPKGD
ncbi:hypothetical protein BYT27DRAFT_7249550 [Phlegmacium glaucopus]|nr:hypothetical protein BYT27DRAFT_7249550 [Phlegmacium glaucopus]